MKKKRVGFCEICGTRHNKRIKYCPDCGSQLIKKTMKILDISVSYDLKIILNLLKIKGRHTLREIGIAMGVRTGQRFYELMNECIKMDLLYKNGIKYIGGRAFDEYSVDIEKCAEFVETHEKSREIKEFYDIAEDEIY